MLAAVGGSPYDLFRGPQLEAEIKCNAKGQIFYLPRKGGFGFLLSIDLSEDFNIKMEPSGVPVMAQE